MGVGTSTACFTHVSLVRRRVRPEPAACLPIWRGEQAGEEWQAGRQTQNGGRVSQQRIYETRCGLESRIAAYSSAEQGLPEGWELGSRLVLEAPGARHTPARSSVRWLEIVGRKRPGGSGSGATALAAAATHLVTAGTPPRCRCLCWVQGWRYEADPGDHAQWLPGCW